MAGPNAASGLHRRLHCWRADAVEVVGLNGSQLPSRSRNASRSNAHAPQVVVGLGGRLRSKSFSAASNSAAGWNAEARTRRSGRGGSSRAPDRATKRAAIAPPSNCPTSTGGAGQVWSISSPSHPSTRSTSIVRRPPRRHGRAGRGRSRDGWRPAPGSCATTGQRAPRPVEQYDRRAVAALQHCGRDPFQVDPALGHRHRVDQPLTGFGTSERPGQHAASAAFVSSLPCVPLVDVDRILASG